MTRSLERIASLCGPSPLGGQMSFFVASFPQLASASAGVLVLV
jgi:hypothetical protein